MIYKIADLDYIYVRVNSKNKTLNEMTDSEFVDWATEKFGIEIEDDMDIKNTPWTHEQKVDFLNYISKKLGQPVVVMIKGEARNKFDREDNINNLQKGKL